VRCSAPDRVCSIADSDAVGGTHSTGCRGPFYISCGRAERPPCLLLLHAPGSNPRGYLPQLHSARVMGRSACIRTTKVTIAAAAERRTTAASPPDVVLTPPPTTRAGRRQPLCRAPAAVAPSGT
jgi:hypothetical protein